MQEDWLMSTKKSSQKYDLRTLHKLKTTAVYLSHLGETGKWANGEPIYWGWIMDVKFIFKIMKLEILCF